VKERLSSIRRRLRETPEILPLLIGVGILLVRSILHLGNSLWLDETITAWVVKDGLRDLVDRAMDFQGQSPFYFLGPWCVTKALGFHEWTLRLPSLVINLFTVAALYQLFRHLAGRTVASYSAAMFAIIAACSSQLQSARPYALAVCCFSLSLLFLTRWALTARWTMMLGFALSTSAVLYAHYLFALGFPLFAAVLMFLGKRSLLQGKDLLAAAVVSGFFALPSAWQLSLLVSKASLYSLSGPPTFYLWTHTLSLDWSTISLLLVVSLMWLTKRDLRARDSRKYESTLLLAICLWVYPSIALAVASIGSNTPVFVPRYGLYGVVGESFIQGILFCFIGSETARRLVFLIVSAMAVLCSPADQFFGEDWRAALRDIPQAPTESSVALLWTGLIETKDQSWVLAPQKRDYLLAPTRIYPLMIETGLIPLDLTKLPPESVFSERDRSVVDSAKRIFLIIRGNSPFIARADEDTTVIRIPWIASNQSLGLLSSKSYRGVSVIELKRMEPHQ
jgi:hypothetical protein